MSPVTRLPCPDAAIPDSSSAVAVITTIDDRELARTMAHAVVEQGLAACVQISAIESVYRWEGAVGEGQEWRLSCKTRRELVKPLKQAIRTQHSYTVPELHVQPLFAVDADYAQWLLDETAGTRPAGGSANVTN